tara:strand:- start:3189 stop:3512 length:324 start_codon:yes stop_codon:yes gene_type:complete
MIKKVFKFLYDILGMPYYFVVNTIKGALVSMKWSYKQFVKFVKKIPSILIVLAKWFVDAIKESIAQVFTLLGFFIAWFTLTGSAQDIVGIAIVISVIIWLVTIRLRD